MAKIDSIGRMRLPPDSGIRTQAYSQRERATSEPVRQAMSDWFQAIAQGRRDNADQSLVNAVRDALTDTANRGEAPPRLLPLQILTRLADASDGTKLYQAQLGQSLLTLSTRTPLEPGQTLVITPGREGPVVVNPETPQQARMVLSVIQQQQLTYLPSPQPRTPLSALVPWLTDTQRTSSSPAPPLTPPSAPPPAPGSQSAQPTAERAGGLPIGQSQTAAPSTQASPSTATAAPGTLQSHTTSPATLSGTVQWLGQALQQVLSQWQQSLPQAPPPVGGGAQQTDAGSRPATDARAAAPGPGPSPQHATAEARGVSLQQSDHWIPQLIRTATAQYGEATPSTVRQVWQSWQQAASQTVRAQPVPDLAQAQLRPPPENQRAAPVPLVPTPILQRVDASTPPVAAEPNQRPSAAAPESGPSNPVRPPGLADLVPLLRQADAAASTRPSGPNTPAPAAAQMRSTDSGAPVPEGRVPADLWRTVAEQLIDLRLSQLGNTQPTSMQEQLHRRAEQILRQVNSTYSPGQLKQQLQGQQAAAADAGANARAAVNAEQQTLLQVRQLLEQVSQQQQIRTLQGTQPDTNSPETLRQIQGIPVLAHQQIEWFELERRKPEEDDQGQEEQESSQRWVLDLHFQLPPLAPVCARLRWDNDHGRIEFLTDDTPTLRAFHAHLASLNQRMSALGLPIEDIQCRHGLPRRAGGPAQGDSQTGDHQIDIHT